MNIPLRESSYTIRNISNFSAKSPMGRTSLVLSWLSLREDSFGKDYSYIAYRRLNFSAKNPVDETRSSRSSLLSVIIIRSEQKYVPKDSING